MRVLDYEHYLVETWSDEKARWELQLATQSRVNAHTSFKVIAERPFPKQKARLVQVLEVSE